MRPLDGEAALDKILKKDDTERGELFTVITKPIFGENVINWRLEVKSCLRCSLSSVASSVICNSKSSEQQQQRQQQSSALAKDAPSWCCEEIANASEISMTGSSNLSLTRNQFEGNIFKYETLSINVVAQSCSLFRGGDHIWQDS